jgi:hypothetical protein
MTRSVPATQAHAQELAGNLSPESSRGMFGAAAAALIANSMKISRESYAVFIGDELLFIWGLREIEPDVARGWFITSNAVAQHPRAFWSASKEIVSGLRAHYRVVYNFIDPQNVLTLRWAEAMGFTIHPEANGFHHAEIRRPDRV